MRQLFSGYGVGSVTSALLLAWIAWLCVDWPREGCSDESWSGNKLRGNSTRGAFRRGFTGGRLWHVGGPRRYLEGPTWVYAWICDQMELWQASGKGWDDGNISEDIPVHLRHGFEFLSVPFIVRLPMEEIVHVQQR